MKFELFSYRNAAEILQHRKYKKAWSEITSALNESPLIIFPGKSTKNARLDVVQQLINTYFDRKFGVDLRWEHHPLATGIAGSKLAADFRKPFGDLAVQVEVQFGNMSRWYSDIFKFQAGYSQKKTDVGVSVVPMSSLAKRIDSNVVNFERTKRELPAADLSITLPILLVGLHADAGTKVIDASRAAFSSIKEITGKGKAENRWRIINAIMAGADLRSVGPSSPTGPMIEETTDNLEQE